MTKETAFEFDGSESQENEAAEPTTFLSRRHLMKGAAGVAGVAAFGGLGLWYGTQPSLAATTYEETDGEVTVETNAGEVIDVRVAPVFTLNWEDFGGGAESFDFDITATVDGAEESVYTETGVSAVAGDVSSFELSGDSLDAYAGSVEIGCATASVLGETITTDSFPTNVAQGTDETTTVTLTLSPTGNQNIGSAVDAAAVTREFDVTVSNPAGTMTAEITSSNAEADGADAANETSSTA